MSKVERKKTILSLQDMTNLVFIYDAVKKLNITMLGYFEVHWKEEGVLGALDRVYDIIENGVCARMEGLGEAEAYEKISRILEEDRTPPEERARRLLGMKGKS